MCIRDSPQAAASLSKSQKKMMAQMKNMDTKDMPDTIISQAAISFVTSEYKAIGLDIDQMQTHYLLVTGAKMIGLAFLIMAAAVSVTLLSARLAAKLSRIPVSYTHLQEELKRLLNKFCDCLDEQTEILKKEII